jgi:hypothetical protein
MMIEKMSTKAKLHSLCVKKSSLCPFSTGSKGKLENHILVLCVWGEGGERVEDEEG